MRRCRPLGAATSVLLGVWLVLTTGLATANALDFPQLSGHVVDQANIISPSIREKLNAAARYHEEQTGNQVVIVTLKSLQGVTIEQFGVQLGRHWGVGQKDKDNGAILIVVPAERKIRIEVGYGLEGRLTDAQARLIIENAIIPEFRAGRMEAGVIAGANAIIGILENRQPNYQEPQKRPRRRSEGIVSEGFWVFFLAIAIFLILAEMGMFAGPRGSRHNDDYGGGYGGGFGSGSSGGGGFSGGGGSFGGGGASGGW